MTVKKPYYNWYASDFLGSAFVQSLEPLEEFCYRRLLDMQATSENGRISGDVKKMRIQCKGISTFGHIWEVIKVKFEPHPDGKGGLANQRLSEILSERDEFLDGRSRAGKLGAEARWKDKHSGNSANGTRDGKAIAKPWHEDSKSDGKPMASTSISTSIPILENLQSLKSPSVPIQEPGERTNEFERQDFQKFWGPVEKYLRSQVVDEVFQSLYAGMRILDMTARHVVVAVPQEFLNQYGGMEYGPASLKHRLEKSGTGLMRNRALKLVALESIESALPKESRVVLAGEVQ
jgi:hypothetical protein